MNVSAITWIRFIGSRQNLAWTYYLTLGTSLRKNFSFFSKSKMAAGGQKLNFDIISAQNSHFGLANGSRSSDFQGQWIQEAINCIPRSQQLPQNLKWPQVGSNLVFWYLTLIRQAYTSVGATKWLPRARGPFNGNVPGVPDSHFRWGKNLRTPPLNSREIFFGPPP